MTQFSLTNIESSEDVLPPVGMDDRYFDSTKYKILALSDNACRNSGGAEMQDISFDSQFPEGQTPDFTMLNLNEMAYLVFEVNSIEDISLAEDSLFSTEDFKLLTVVEPTEEA